MKTLGHLPFLLSSETVAAKDKTPWERILAALVALSTLLFAPWDKHPRLSALLLAIAFLLIISAFGRIALPWYRARWAQTRRNRVAHAQFPELLEFVKRFGQFVDSRDGNNLPNVLFPAAATIRATSISCAREII
jgi:hypothetical protein